MAPPTDLRQVGEEVFPMIDEFFGRQQRTPSPPSRREPKFPCRHQPHRQIRVYHYTESPPITRRRPYAQVLPNGTVLHYTQHQYKYQPSPTIGFVHEVSQYEDSDGRV
ncbi:hypothetical protein CDL15_Pgr011330 [Punica granatum]|uniref:Uncharacterized protein n=1 Tax=Punica granatum TaxID=22663 RepID=A0A218WF79_PUNGR|nr:hypothetical protein CDL15_Pgr011330 [Punica granatum]PKI65050.1 hypothetical protein CRG98_014519 [Punica granatum]